jgi:hypothetical protein
MDYSIAYRILEDELQALRRKPYSELAARVKEGPEWKEVVAGEDGKRYNVQTEVLWDAERGGAVRVMAMVDDGTALDFICPTSDDFIMAPDGSFIGE